MTIFLFGLSNVGKTTAGELLAHKLGYDFYDLDEEVKKYYNTTLEDFVNMGSLEQRDRKRRHVIDMVMKKEENKVFVIAPMAYPDNFNRYLACEDVVAIKLQDSSEHIFDRLVLVTRKIIYIKMMIIKMLIKIIIFGRLKRIYGHIRLRS